MARPTYFYAVYRWLASPTAHKKADMAKRGNAMVAERVEMEEPCE